MICSIHSNNNNSKNWKDLFKVLPLLSLSMLKNQGIWKALKTLSKNLETWVSGNDLPFPNGKSEGKING